MNMTQNQTLTQQIEQLLQQAQIQLQQYEEQFQQDKLIIEQLNKDKEQLKIQEQFNLMYEKCRQVQFDHNEKKREALKVMLREICSELKWSEEIIDRDIRYYCHGFYETLNNKRFLNINVYKKEKEIMKMIETFMPTKLDVYTRIYLDAMNWV